MSKTNSKLKSIIGEKKPIQQLVVANNIPKPDTVNQQGLPAYSQDKWLKLLTMLNTLKLEPQYYRTELKTLKELQDLIQVCATENVYFTCQCIVYSRCMGEGMRTISHAAAVFVAPYLSGQEFAKNFYSSWDKKKEKGGIIYRPDDMSEILSGFIALNPIGNTKLTNAMKKGFKSTLENMETYHILKYKSSLIDVINLVHPSPSKSQATVMVDEKEIYTIDAIMQGMNVSADTWEVNQGNAGQIVAQAVRDGKIDDTEAKEMLIQAKADNWEELLNTNKLGILAGIRNLRNILINNPTQITINKVCDLVSNPKLIREGKIMPYQLDVANEIMLSEFSNSHSRQISQAINKGYELAVPNLREMLTGNNIVYLDQSGSMGMPIVIKGNKNSKTNCISKAALIAATIVKATNADIIAFGATAKYISYNPNLDLFTLANQLSSANMGGTNLSTAWQLAQKSDNKYDRVFILSDNEVNKGSTYNAYISYLRNIGNPYVYSVDLGGYGTNSIVGDKVRYYYGYGFSMFDDIATSEFNANHHIDKVRKINL